MTPTAVPQDSTPTRREVLACYTGVRVLVLGASGFIGRWVARLLTEAGADLWLTARELSAQSVLDAYGIQGRLTTVDLGDGTALTRLLQAAQPAVVFNLAGYGVDRAERDRDQAYRINAVLVKDLCHSLADASAPLWPGQRLVHAGSACWSTATLWATWTRTRHPRRIRSTAAPS